MNFRLAAAPLSIAAALSIAVFAGPVAAQECTSDADPYELDDAGVNALYDCIGAQMAEAYAKNESDAAQNYRSWAVTSTRPAIAGPHGERFLQTFANEVAAEQYLKFEEDGVVMPVGSVLAKESFKISKGKVRVGPLFLMTKVALEDAPETGGWVYGGVQPNGKEMKFKQAFCHDCHSAWESQDALAYPLEEVRIGTGG